MSLLGPEPARRRHKLALSPLGHERVLLSEVLILLHVLISFFRDMLPINMKMLVFFPAKCVRTAVKNYGCGQKALSLLYLASKPLRNAANSSDVPTEFATELTRQI